MGIVSDLRGRGKGLVTPEGHLPGEAPHHDVVQDAGRIETASSGPVGSLPLPALETAIKATTSPLTVESLPCKESKSGSKGNRQLPLERCPVTFHAAKTTG